MKYSGIPTTYKGVRFRSRLEARYAVFFDLVGWEWMYEPVELDGWIPDFWVKFPCRHSECSGSHELYVEVKPYHHISEFKGHPVTKIHPYEVPSPAMFGVDPNVSHWEMGHGAGGGEERIECWVEHGDWKTPWLKAGNKTQWKKK